MITIIALSICHELISLSQLLNIEKSQISIIDLNPQILINSLIRLSEKITLVKTKSTNNLKSPINIRHK
ncbi:uncharacterized protein DS421_15g503240 [Arachis hypogaea]|nr:uncharacterized protein DS421_15g503240 [Arachis hypogaea]